MEKTKRKSIFVPEKTYLALVRYKTQRELEATEDFSFGDAIDELLKFRRSF
jgi:hypothetical protein